MEYLAKTAGAAEAEGLESELGRMGRVNCRIKRHSVPPCKKKQGYHATWGLGRMDDQPIIPSMACRPCTSYGFKPNPQKPKRRRHKTRCLLSHKPLDPLHRACAKTASLSCDTALTIRTGIDGTLLPIDLGIHDSGGQREQAAGSKQQSYRRHR